MTSNNAGQAPKDPAAKDMNTDLRAAGRAAGITACLLVAALVLLASCANAPRVTSRPALPHPGDRRHPGRARLRPAAQSQVRRR